ncbi:MAG TPA: ATP-binding protein, partial [Anaerolineales bacterium]|nr:ATP-binding protein [Anaerolineales bacterium]
ALETGATLSVPDAQNDARFRTDGSGDSRVGAIIVAPVKFGEQNLGTLSIYSSQKDVFTPDDERLLTMLGANAAVAIEKTRLYANLQATLKQEQAARAQLVQSEKLAALGRIVASVAHELNNPLQAIQNALYLIRLEEDLSNQAIEDLQVALNEANRMAALIQRLRETYRPTSGEDYEMASLNELVLEAHKLISAHLRHQNILFKFEGDEDVPEVRLVPDQIKQVILNICLNAVEMMADHPTPEDGHFLHLGTRYRPDTQTIELSITDNGPGIDQVVLPYIFDPFVTTKDNGTGLGLAITYDIVRRHNGRVEVKSEPGHQTTFLVELPAQ